MTSTEPPRQSPKSKRKAAPGQNQNRRCNLPYLRLQPLSKTRNDETRITTRKRTKIAIMWMDGMACLMDLLGDVDATFRVQVKGRAPEILQKTRDVERNDAGDDEIVGSR